MTAYSWRARTNAMIKNDLSHRLKKLSEDSERGIKGWSLRAGLNETAVRDAIETGNPTYRTIVALARERGMNPAELAFGTSMPKTEIKVMGIVSAGDGWTNPDSADNGDVIEFAMDDGSMFAIEIRGDSMFPVYRDGDYLICRRKSAYDIRNCIGLDCAIRTKSGDGYIKRLLQGSRAGRFDLQSYNISYDYLRDVDVEWAAPVQWVKRCTTRV